MSKTQTVTNAKGRFGTFAGVFTPNVLTILGIILFLRTGWVVGQAGLVNGLIIVAIANTISFLTGLSLSSIATSMTVKTGGNYFMISRSLGLSCCQSVVPWAASSSTGHVRSMPISATRGVKTVMRAAQLASDWVASQR